MTYPGPGPQQYYPPGYFPPGYFPPSVKMVMTVGGRPLADPMERFVAYLLDSLIVGAVLLIPYIGYFVYVVNQFSHQMNQLSQQSANQPLGTPFRFNTSSFLIPYAILLVSIFVLQTVASYIYYVKIQQRNGQTVGKRVMKIMVVRQADGGPFDARMARRRWLTQFPGGFLPGFNYANVLWLLWDEPFRQCLHDKTAETVVVKVSPPVKVGP